jgi:S-adenosylmethionine:tRNA-ribosyltransferase-isomerase (queuine synthetase)
MRIEDFDYGLPAGQIAQHPPAQRDGARMLMMDRRRGQLSFPGFYVAMNCSFSIMHA